MTTKTNLMFPTLLTSLHQLYPSPSPNNNNPIEQSATIEAEAKMTIPFREDSLALQSAFDQLAAVNRPP
jgi:hypothetical protein